MGFKFAARTLLELGKELISSDEVALYELIKNAIDAKSPRVEIVANIVLIHSHYLEALDALEDGKSADIVLELIKHHMLVNSPQESADDFLAELTNARSNLTRFKAILQSVYKKHNWIEVRDQGHGMSLDELDNVYLTVGTRSRRADNIAGAQYLGDKGVGRLSAMRLGDWLEVQTTRAHERHYNLLEIDWSLFNHESEVDVGSIEVEPREGPLKKNVSDHGTIIRISALSGNWSNSRFAEMLNGPVARMVDPFEPGRANELLHVRHNGERLLIPSIPQALLRSAHAMCKASLRFEHGEPIFEGLIDYRLRHAKRPINQRGVEVYSVTQQVTKQRGKKGNAAVIATSIRPQALKDLGPFEVEIFWYNRLIVEAVEGLTEKISETREQISRWSGGPMLYRHGFRVLPYGNPDDDWLELDKKAFGLSGFKLNRQQILGRIRVKSAHTALGEQTNREGLVQSQASSALKALMMWLLHTEFRNLINEADAAEQMTKREAEEVAYEFRETEKKVSESLLKLSANLPAANKAFVERLVKSIGSLAEQCAAVVNKTEKVIEASIEEREKFVYLAGIGLITEFIFHELDRSVEHAIREIMGAQKDFPKSTTLKALEGQLVTLHKRISAFDELTGEKRQTKSNFDLSELVGLVLKSHANQFKRHQINISFDPPSQPVKIRAVKGMVIQIIENLLVNSVYWLKHQSRYQPEFQPEILISIDPEGNTLSITDNGPGVDPERREAIFQPFVSSKPAGQGRGLGLFISRELAQYHGWTLYMDPVIGRSRARRLNTFVLELGNKK